MASKFEKIAFRLKKLKRDLSRGAEFYPMADDVHSSKLGEYYFLMFESALLAGISQNFHFDDDGIPLIPTYIDVEERKLIYYPISIGQYGLAIFHTYLETGSPEDRSRFLKIADWFYNARVEEKARGVFWLSEVPKPEYRMFDPWPSAFAQSRGISILLRAYQLTDDVKYRDTAIKALKIYEIPAKEGGVTTFSENGPLYEEYPAQFPTVVLDGTIFSLFGLYDCVRAVPESEQARRLFDEGIAALKKTLPAFDLGYWIRYNLCREDFYPKLDPASIGYFILINSQLRILYKITGDEYFLETANCWMKYNRLSSKIRMYWAKYWALRKLNRI